MDCKNCGYSLPDEAVFCPSCGSRVDGKKQCISCKKLVNVDAVFCAHCGARLDGKIKCIDCGKYYNGDFCPFCGTASKTVNKEPAKVEQKTQKSANVTSFFKTERILSPSLLLCSILILFICSFFVGFSYKFIYDGITYKESVTTFNFFKDLIDNANASINIAQQSLSPDNLALYSFYIKFPLIVAIVLLALNIFVSLVSLVYGSIKYGVAMKTGNSVNLTKITAISFSVFVCTAAYTLIYCNLSASALVRDFSTRLSTGSLLGIIFGIVLIISALVLKTIKDRKTALSINCLIKLICFAVLFILLFVAVFTLKSFIVENNSGIKASFSSSAFLRGMGGLLLTYLNKQSSGTLREFNILSTSAILGFIFFLAILIALGLLIYFTLNAMASEKPHKKRILTFSLLTLFLTIGYFVVSIIAEKYCIIFPDSQYATYSIGTIPVFVLSIVISIISIVYAVIIRKKPTDIQE
ncbi:MAG: zinc ribbon domain-containing protein [Clostridia bacterium]|nr:zinc ribbon domain-containing protein [Clostridia bacterium]